MKIIIGLFIIGVFCELGAIEKVLDRIEKNLSELEMKVVRIEKYEKNRVRKKISK